MMIGKLVEEQCQKTKRIGEQRESEYRGRERREDVEGERKKNKVFGVLEIFY